MCHPSGFVIVQNPKFQEPVTLDFLDAELEDEIKVEVRMQGCVRESRRLIWPILTSVQINFTIHRWI